MNRLTLRTEIIADLKSLLQAAKEQPNYTKVIGNIGQLKDSNQRNYYMNIPAGRRATAQEIAQTFGQTETSSGRARTERDNAQVKLDSSVVIRKIADAMPGIPISEEAKKQITDQALIGQIKDKLQKEAELKVAQVGEKTYETISQISDSLKANFPSIHTNLEDPKLKEKFDELTKNTVDKFKNSPAGKVTSFAQEKMTGLGTTLSQAAGSTWEDLSKSQVFVETSAEINGAIQAIQDKASPDTPQVNVDISNLAFSINMAQAQLMFAGMGKDPKVTESGKALIEEYKGQITNLKPPVDQGTIQKIKDEFFSKFQKEIAKASPEEKTNEATTDTTPEEKTNKTTTSPETTTETNSEGKTEK